MIQVGAGEGRRAERGSGSPVGWSRCWSRPGGAPWLSARLLRRLVNERRVPFSASRRDFFDLGELDDWVEAARVEPSISRTGGRRVSG